MQNGGCGGGAHLYESMTGLARPPPGRHVQTRLRLWSVLGAAKGLPVCLLALPGLRLCVPPRVPITPAMSGQNMTTAEIRPSPRPIFADFTGLPSCRE